MSLLTLLIVMIMTTMTSEGRIAQGVRPPVQPPLVSPIFTCSSNMQAKVGAVAYSTTVVLTQDLVVTSWCRISGTLQSTLPVRNMTIAAISTKCGYSSFKSSSWATCAALSTTSVYVCTNFASCV